MSALDSTGISRLEDLLDLQEDGGLSAAEEDELAALLDAGPGARRALIERHLLGAEITRQMRQRTEAARLAREGVQRPPEVRRRYRQRFVAVSALAAAAVVLVFVGFRQHSGPQLEKDPWTGARLVPLRGPLKVGDTDNGAGEVTSVHDVRAGDLGGEHRHRTRGLDRRRAARD